MDDNSQDKRVTMDSKAFDEMMARIERSLNIKLEIHLAKIFERIELKKKYNALELFKELYLNQKQAADTLSCSERSIQRYTSDGMLKVSKVGKKLWYKVSDLIAFLDSDSNNLPDITDNDKQR